MLRRLIGMRIIPGAGLLTVVVLLGGCGAARVTGAPTASTESGAAHEVTTRVGQFCPDRLPVGEDPGGHGFGVQRDATATPTLPALEQAWVCRYDPVDVGVTPEGGAVFEWRLGAPARALDESLLPRVATALAGIRPFPGGRGCTDDLGPRWMIAYSHDGDDPIGVVVDDYGCREVRLTDDPFRTPPGAGHRDGTVEGVLDGGADILEQLGPARSG